MNTKHSLYFEAVAYFRETVSMIRPDQWDAPGLGVWSVRELVGHTIGALSNVQRDITQPHSSPADYESSADYFAAATATPGVMAAVAERGREAGAALGPDPVRIIDDLTDVVRALLSDSPFDGRVATRFGTLPLGAYLNTKIFELVVHTLDICAATGISLEPPAGPLAAALRVTLQLAARRSDITESAGLLRALTGRATLSAGYSVI